MSIYHCSSCGVNHDNDYIPMYAGNSCDPEKQLEHDLAFVNRKLEKDPDNGTLRLERRMILWELYDETED